MFVVRASVWLAALERFRPDIAAATRDGVGRPQHRREFRAPGCRGVQARAERIDRLRGDGALQPRRRSATGIDVRMVALDAGWSDLGAWDAVWQVGAKDAAGNCSVGDAMLHDSRNTLVHATSRLVSVIGLDDIVVVETPDAVLVTRRERSQDVKHVVAALDQPAAASTRCIARCTAPGAGTTASMPASASRSSASWSSRARR